MKESKDVESSSEGSQAHHTTTIFRNMVVLASGSAIAKLIGLLSIPVITRIYAPSDMGILAVFTSLITLLAPLFTLRYSVALPLPKSDRLAASLVMLCFASLLITSLFTVTILILFAEPILNLLNMQALLPYWFLLLVGAISTGFYEILTQWATREKAFKNLARTKIWQSSAGAIAKVGLGFAGITPLGLLIGQIITQAGGIVSLSVDFYRKFKANFQYISKKNIIFLMQRYIDFPKYRLPSQFLLVASSQSPLLFSAWIFGAETTGQLGLAMMALGIPLTLFGQTTAQAYYAQIARIGRKQPDKVWRVTKNVTKKLFILAIIPFCVLLIGAPFLFYFVFGSEWVESGIFARSLSIYLLFQFVSAPIVGVFSVFGREKKFLYINLTRSILIALVFLSISFFEIHPVKAITLYSVTMALHYVLVYLSVYRFLNESNKKVFVS